MMQLSTTKKVLKGLLFLLLTTLSSILIYATPSVTVVYPAGQTINISDTIAINATITDSDGVDDVFANVSYPNGTKEQLTLTNTEGDSYTANYVIPQSIGQFNITFIANDTLGNVNNSVNTSFVSDLKSPRSVTNLRAWYDAADNSTLYTNTGCSTLVSSEGQDINCWADKSDYMANATMVSGKGVPIFAPNQFNGNSVVNFSKSQSDTLRHVIPSQYTSDFTIFIVLQSRDTSPETFESFFSNGEPADTNHFQIDYTETSDAFRYGSSTKFDFGAFDNEIKLYSVTHDGNNIVMYNDGSQVNSGSTTEGRVFEHYRINQNRNGDRHHDSFIGEIALYSRVLDSCEQEKVNNYLGAKYGKDFSGIADRYEYSGNFPNDINGIGIFLPSECSPVPLLSEAKSDFLTISNPNSVDQNDTLTFGHDDGNLTVSSEAPGTYKRVLQEWRADIDDAVGGENDGVGNVTVTFDLSSNTSLLNYTNFVILTDSDGDFSNANILNITGTISGNTIIFENVSFSDGDYFTLGFNDTTPPSVTSIIPIANSNASTGTIIEIGTNVTDNIEVDTVLANITLPNGTKEQLTLTKNENKYNTSYIVPINFGTFTVLFIANDTSGNLNNSETTTFITSFVDPTSLNGIQLWYDSTDNTTLYTDTTCTTQVSSDNQEILCWEDKAGGDDNATVVSGKYGPRYRSASSELINSLTTLRFNKSNETVYETGFDIRSATNENITSFSVYRPRTTNTSDQGQGLWGNDNGAWDRFFYSLFAQNGGLGTDGIDDGLISLGGASSGLSIDGSGIVDEIFLLTAVYNGNVTGGVNSGPTNGSQIYFDGVLQVNFTDESDDTAAQTQLYLGWDGDNGHYDGDYAETIVYNRLLTACEIELVNNYLGNKYGKDFNRISNNYEFSSPHNNDINGIGVPESLCDPASAITSAQSDFLTVSSATDAQEGDLVTFGHDNGNLTIISEAPGIYHRVQQEWRVDIDNTPGNVTLSFDLTGNTTLLGYNNFVLFIDSNGDFSDATIINITGTISGNTVTFSNVSFSNGDYFTIGFNDTSVPSVFALIPEQNTNFTILSTITIAANVTDSVGVDTVLANITLPNSSINQITLSLETGNKYSTTYTLSNLTGQYNITYIANDTTGNINKSETTFFNADAFSTPQISFVDPTPASDTSIDTNTFTINISSSNVDSDHYTFVDYQEALFGWYRFDDKNSSGDLSPVDLSSHSNNATLESGAFINDSGRFGKAVQFDGTDDYILLPNSDVSFAGGLSICAWVYWDSFTESWARITDLGQGQSDDNILFAHSGTTTDLVFEVYVGASSGGQITASNVLIANTWQHLCASLNASGNASIYVDGVIVQNGSTGVPANVNRDQMYIGRSAWSGDGYFNGAMDEIVLFNRTLQNSEILSMYNATANQYQANFITSNDGNQSFIGYAVSTNGQKNQTELRTIISDSTVPGVIPDSPVSGSEFNLDTQVEVAANITDTVAVHTVLANITLPNGTIRQFTLSNEEQNKYNISFNETTAIGGYSVRFIANDTVGNVNHSETTSFTLVNNKTPGIEFVSTPTPVNNSLINKNNFLVNVSSDSFDSNDHYTFVDFDDTIILWMRMDETNSSGDPGDLSKYHNNGTLQATAKINATGKFGDALHVDGDSDFVRIDDSESLKIGKTDFTYSLWFNSNEVPSATRQLFCKRVNSAGNYEVQLESGGEIRTWIGDANGSATNMDSGTIISANTWYHVTVTRGNGTLYLYVNGVLENQTASVHNVSSSSDLFIGRDAPSAAEFFNGAIDEVLLFNRSFSAAEVQSLYNASKFQYQNNFTSLADGNYTYIGYAVSTNARRNQTEQRLLAIDTTPPSVIKDSPVQNAEYDLNTQIEIAANVTDIIAVDTVLANITLPNGSIEQTTLTNVVQNKYNASFNVTSSVNQYTIRFIANDTAGNINTSETVSFIIIDNRTPNINFTTPPTPLNNSVVTQNNFVINISSNSFESNEHYTFIDFDDKLSLWMRFDDVNSSGDPVDISTKGNNGSLSGDALINTTGRFGDALHLDGTGDYIDTEIDSNLLASNSTISAWINLNTLSQDDSRIVADDDNDQGWALSYGDSSTEQRIRFFIRGMDTVSLDADNVITQPNTWYHVAVILDRTNDIRYIYINGTLEASLSSDTGSPTSDSGTMTIGSESSASSESDTDLDGAIDEVLIFNRSLTEAEVLSLYNATSYQYQNNLTSLAEGNHTFIGYAVSTNGQKNQTGTRIVTVDSIPPSVIKDSPIQNAEYDLNTQIDVAANVTDILSVDTVLANITLPNGTIRQFTLSNEEQNKYNISFNETTSVGTHTILFIANDTAGNVNDSQTISFSLINNKTPNIAFVTPPTPTDGSIQNQNSIVVNVSSDSFDSNDHYTFIDFDDRLTLWMRFDDVNGSGDPVDISTKGNNGSLSGDALINTTGRFGDAAHFDGNGDFINLPASNVLIPNGDASWTMSTWFNAGSIGSGNFANRIITVRNAPGLSAISFTLGQNDKIQFFYRDGGGSGTTTDIRTIATDTWYHYAVSYNGSDFLIYVDGELNATITDSMASTSSDTARIGANPSGSSEFFNGSIDDILLFDRSLSTQDVLSLYNASRYQYENNFTALAEGNHTVTGYAVSTNGRKNQTEQRLISIDTTPPNVTNLIPVAETSFNENTNIEIAANATDISNVSAVLADVIYPNGTVQTLTLSNTLGNKYNTSFTIPSLGGTFVVNITANDTVNNINKSEQTNFTSTQTFSPGGISPTLTLWLDAGKNTTLFQDSCGGTTASQGDTVGCWEDRSGNNNHVNSSGTARPILETDSSKLINFNPTIDFDGSNDYVEDEDGESYINGVSEFSTFVVVDSTSASTDGYMFNAESGSEAESPWGLRFDNTGALSSRDDTLKTGINTGSPTLYEGDEDNIASADPMLASVHWNSGEAPTLFVDGRSVPLHASTTKSGTLTSANYVRVGHEANQAFWSGGISELIYYQSRLNTTAQYKVASYLAVKYGITLDSSVNYVDSDNNTIYASQTSHVNYTNDIAGIGIDTTSDLNQSRSQSINSDSIVQMRNASSIDNLEFLIWGNDNTSVTEISSNMPLGIATRLERTWRIDKTGDPGTVTVLFNLSGLTISGNSVNDFNLLIDSDENFTDVSVISATGFSDNVVRFESISFNDNNFFTITTLNDTIPPNVTDIVASPTPTFNLTEKIDINATIKDAIGVDVVSANITLPDNSVQQFNMSLLTGNIYNFSFTLSSLIGTYTVRIFANDTINNINSSETGTFELQNGLPQASAATVNEGSDVTLAEGTNTTVIGTATITDGNGFGHITGVTGYLFETTIGIGATDNRSNHYTETCISNGDGNANTISYNCTFNVSHYAVPTDTSANLSITNWTFTIVPSDSIGVGSNATDIAEVNTLLAFTINPTVINFGELDLGANTTTSNQEINVTNLGNVGIDVVLSGTNLSCEAGLVPVNFLEYEDNPFEYGVGTDLLESGVELDLDARVGYQGNETPLRSTYYGLKVPDVSVGGSCTGSIIITGQADPGID